MMNILDMAMTFIIHHEYFIKLLIMNTQQNDGLSFDS